MLKGKLHYFNHLMRRADSLEKTPMLGKIEGRRRSGTDSKDMGLSNCGRQQRTGKPAKRQTRLSNNNNEVCPQRIGKYFKEGYEEK